MNLRFLILTAIVIGLAGCGTADQKQHDAAKATTDQIEQLDKKPTEAGADDNGATHVIVNDTSYFKSGPQQARPPDGTFKAGTRVTVIENIGSYLRVRSTDGVEAYAAAEALKPVGSESKSE